MRWLIPLLFTLLAGCPTPKSHPYDACDDFEPCLGDEFTCVGFRCVPDCRLEGDCDPGYRCIDGRCLAECEAESDCDIGTCAPIGDGKRGDACLLRNLPQCTKDDHCGFAVCIDGACEARCDWVGQCGPGMLCDFVRERYGYCVEDPDYVPPEPPANCTEAAFPDDWCRQNRRGAPYCNEATRECTRRYEAIFIEDVSANCGDVDDGAPGPDIVGVNVYDSDGNSVGSLVSHYERGHGDNAHADLHALATEGGDFCAGEEPPFLSLGCVGHLIMISRQTPMYAGWNIEVVENAWCGPDDVETDLAHIYACERFPADLEYPYDDCYEFVGSTEVGTRFTIAP